LNTTPTVMKPGDWIGALLSLLVTLLAIEIVLNHFANTNSRPVFGVAGKRHDSRDWLHALYDLRAAGNEAYPIVSAEVYAQNFRPTGDATPLLPLAGLSNTTTTFCNELQQFIVFRSDRYGFRNDDWIWDAKPPVMLVGDSYAQGACVPAAATLPAELARRGFPTVSLAYNSNGPLAELASLVEYGPLVRPPLVVWLYHEGNDPTDLGREMEVATLRRYFEPHFQQGLARRQSEIDQRIRDALDARPEIRKVADAAKNHWSVGGLLALRNTRALAVNVARIVPGWTDAPKRAAPELDDAVGARIPDQRLSDLEITLARAKEVAATWGGTLIFAYLPASERYRFPALPAVAELAKDQAEVVQIAASLGLPVIDLHAALSAAPDPAQLYPAATWPVHLNVEGYRVIAAAIARELQAQSGRR
jgi:hypothetical protein